MILPVESASCPVLSVPFVRERLFRLRTFAAICDLIAESRCGCAGLVCGPSLRICRIVCPAVPPSSARLFQLFGIPVPFLYCFCVLSRSVRMRFPYRLYFCSVCPVPVLSCSCLVLSYPILFLSRSVLSCSCLILSYPVPVCRVLVLSCLVSILLCPVLFVPPLP